MKEIIYLVEGQTEIELINSLDLMGKVIELNLWQKPISKIQRRFKPNTVVYVIYDTDVLDGIELFHKNLRQLKKDNRLAGIIQQTDNLEDELVRACQSIKKHSQLFEVFQAVSASEFKSNFIKTTQVLDKLNGLGFDPNLLWRQAVNDKIANEFHKFVVSYETLAKNIKT